MLVHKGGQINNVQLITGLRIAEMSQLQNCENSKKKFFRRGGGGGWSVQGGGVGFGGGGGGGVRVDVNGEVKLL